MKILAFILASLLFCASAAPAACDLSDEYVHGTFIDNIPFIGQRFEFGAPAALVSVFRFYGVSADQDLIGELLHDEDSHRSAITDVRQYVQSRGFRTTLAKGTPDKLKELVDAGIPVIVFMDEGLWFRTRSHYAVVFGYTDTGFVMHNGYEPCAYMHFREFERKWNEQGSPLLAIYP